jgi:hypothetical protein
MILFYNKEISVIFSSTYSTKERIKIFIQNIIKLNPEYNHTNTSKLNYSLFNSIIYII